MALRKKSALRSLPEPGKDEELLIFGYQCNIFRDDEKALYIDQGKHLIPWNGDDAIMIDRYDVRAYINDLSEYDADVIRSRIDPMTEKERQVEKLLDEERYLELRVDMREKIMYEEEEMKRLNEALSSNSYGAVGFNYDASLNGAEQTDGDQGQDTSACYSQPYVMIPDLHVPSGMIVPKTMKMHAIIEKTASFVSKQGAQMEIILKTKQKDNEQFEFLNYEHELNPYYKHLVSVIRHGKYQPAPAAQSQLEDHDETHSYLHPSLTSSSEVREPEPTPLTSQEFLESIQSKLPAGQIANTPYAKLLSNLRKHAAVIAPKAAEPVSTNQNDASASHQGHDLQPPPAPPPLLTSNPPHSSTNELPVDDVGEGSPVEERRSSPKKKRKHKEEVSEQTKDDSRKETSDPVHGPQITPPPPDQQPIIDKMADYVARNGPEFEMVVKMKKDERFRFLEADHILHNYYQHKKNIFLKEMEKWKVEEKKEEQEQASGCDVEPETEAQSVKELNGSSKEKGKEKTVERTTNVNKAVSFSIKPKEEEATSLKTKTALLYDSSDEEDEDDGQGSSKGSESDAASAGTKPPSRNNSRASLVPALYDRNPEEAEKKHAEQKLADRLAAAAREKLARDSRERQLQAQRKRKAAMFINMLKDANSSSSSPLTNAAVAAADRTALDSLTGSIDSPFNSSIPSRSVTPTLFLEQAAALPISTTVPPSEPAPIPPSGKLTSHPLTSPRSHIPRKRSRSRSRNRSRSPKRHRKHSKTLPSAYTFNRRSGSKSPSRHSRSKHKSKHSRGRSRSRSLSKSKPKRNNDMSHKRSSQSNERRTKKESEPSHKSSHKSSHHKKKSSKDQDSSRRHKSKKHKPKSKNRSSSSSESEVESCLKGSKGSSVRSSVSKANPVVVDLTGSPRFEEDCMGNANARSGRTTGDDNILPHIEMLTRVHTAWKARKETTDRKPKHGADNKVR